ncbi:MAG: type IV secretion system protein VirB3 [Salinisphaera sp.]|nr:type IV secretion system protein VirB3 [Salinisphaera sp.]
MEQAAPDADTLFVGLTRPAMAFGVTYSYAIIEGMAAAIAFLGMNNLLGLLVVVPFHLVGYLACRRDPRIFDLAFARFTRCPPVRNSRHWRCNAYRP